MNSPRASNSRRQALAAEWDRFDAVIKSANESKRDAANGYRKHLVGQGADKAAVKSELEAFRKAFARRRDIKEHGETAVAERDELVDSILAEIGSPRAARDAREIIEEFDAETGEITDPVAPAPSGVTDTPEGDDSRASGDTESTAARMDVPISGARARPGDVGSGAVGSALDTGREVVGSRPTSPRKAGAVKRGVDPTPIAHTAGTQAPPVDTRTSIQRTMDAVNDHLEAEKAAPKNPHRPHCLKPDMCASSEARRHCFECGKAHADAEGFSA